MSSVIPEWAPSMALYSHLVNNIGGEAGLVLRHQSIPNYPSLELDWSALEEGGQHFFYLHWVDGRVQRKIEDIANNGLVINFESIQDGWDAPEGYQTLIIDRAKATHCETILRRWLATEEGKAAVKANEAKSDIVTKVTYQ